MKKKIIILLAVCICLAAVCIAIALNDEKKENGINYEASGDTYTIETKLCDLVYPKEWQEKITIIENDEQGYNVQFYTDDIHLFDICFNNNTVYTVGEIENDGETIKIGVNSYDIDENEISEKEYEDLCKMQEDVNVILSYLSKTENMKTY